MLTLVHVGDRSSSLPDARHREHGRNHAWMLDELPSERAPWTAARQPFGRIAIANSDALANAMTEDAIGAAELAVEALIPDGTTP